MIIAGRTSLLAFIDEQKAAQKLTAVGLLDRAGLSGNTIANLRRDRKRGLNFETALAIINALGFNLSTTAAEPDHYALEYHNRYNVEWRAVSSTFDTLEAARDAKASRELNASSGVQYRIVAVTREIVE